MGFNQVSALLAAVLAMSTPAAAQAACDPAAGLTFICGLTNAEDLVQVPGTPWIVASGLADSVDGRTTPWAVKEQREAAVAPLYPPLPD